MTQGRIWQALQLYQSMLTILVPCNFTPSYDPLCTRLILVSTLGVFIRPWWTVRYRKSFWIFTMQVDLACPLGKLINQWFLLIIFHLTNVFVIYLYHKPHPCTEIEVKSFKYMCLLTKNLFKKMCYRAGPSYLKCDVRDIHRIKSTLPQARKTFVQVYFALWNTQWCLFYCTQTKRSSLPLTRHYGN